MTKSDEDIVRELLAAGYTTSSVIHTESLAGLFGQRGGPERYGRIFQLLAAETSDPTRKAGHLLSAVYGFRNGSGRWDKSRVQALLSEAARASVQMPPGEEQKEMERRRLYHLGLVQREVFAPNHFLEAAATHEAAAMVAPTPAKRAIEMVVAAVEILHHAVESGGSLNEPLLLLAEKTNELNSSAGSDSEAEKWIRVDVPLHRFYCCELVGRNYPERSADLTSARTIPVPFAAQYAPWVLIVNSMDDLDNGRLLTALQTADQVVTKGIHPTHTLLGLSTQARALEGLGLPGLAREVLDHMVEYPSHGGHFVRAIARRKLGDE